MSLWTPYEPEQALDLSKSSMFTQNYSPVRQSPPAIVRNPDCYLSPSLYSRYHPYAYQTPSPPQLVPGHYEMAEASIPASPSSSDGGRGKKLPRPFKAVTAALPECGAAVDPDPNYAAFRAAMLEAMRVRNGGSLTTTNPRMRRAVHRSDTTEDGEYLQRRARNNAAAKRSRDSRKQKEDELAIRAAYLERLNTELRSQIAASNRCDKCLQVLC